MRFPEFSEEWEYKSLGEIGESLIGLTYSPSDVVKEGGTIVFRSSNIQDGVINYGDLVRVSKKIKDSIITRDGDLLICARNGSTRLIGKNALLKKSDEGQTFGAFMMVFRSIDNRFVHQLLSTKAYSTQVSENLGARINQITTRNFAEYTFGMPQTSEEKEKIGTFLELINDRIETQSKIIEDKETLYKAISNILFSHYANSSPTYQLGDLANLYQPETIPSTKLSRGGRYLVYGANGIIGRYDKYNHEESQICLTCRGNTCGNINFSQPYSWITGNAMVINIDSNTDKIDKRFLYHYLHNYNFSPFISGSGQPQIVRSTVEKLPVPNVNIQTQKKIASILDCIVMSIDIARKKVDMDQNVKKYLLENLFI